MAGEQASKRKLAGTSQALPPGKKQKTHPQPAKSKKKPNRLAGASSLRWTTSKIPDITGDAEGFYGLEEVDDVEVIKNPDNTVRFKTKNPVTAEESDDEAADGDDFEGFGDEATSGPEANESTTQPDASAAEVTEPPASQDKPTKPEKKTKKQKKEEAKEKQKAKKVENAKKAEAAKKAENAKKADGSKQDAELESNVFTALEDMDVDEDEADMSAWARLDLSPQLLSSLAKLKFAKPTAIQQAAIPHILLGHDVIGKASTGSGKTLAFGIPIVERWLDASEANGEAAEAKGPIALILSPTRELAHQLTEHIKNLCAGLATAPFVCSVTGGLSVQKQQRQLAKADIVVGTPGRLWEVLSSSTELMAKFKAVSFLVVDEADRLLSEGHFKEAEEILNGLDRYEVEEDAPAKRLQPRQTLVFSATFHKGLQQKLAGKGKFGLMNQEDSMEYLLKKLNFREEKPKFVDVNPVSQMAEGLKEGLVECGAMEKDLYLYTLLLLCPNARTLVFTNSISAARRITPMLQNLNLPTHPLHSQMAQKARLRSVERFASAPAGKAAILVATDVAARGLDIPGVEMVIHYHVPRAADAYVHRSGRTARARQTGLSVLICAPEEVVPTRRLIAKVHSESAGRSANFFVQTLDVDHKLAGRLKPRVTLAKKLADTALAKEKGGKEDDWMRKAAEDLGVEYDSDELEKAGKWGGRGGGNRQKQDAARGLSKAETAALRAELRGLLARRVNAGGVSERYIATGLVDMDELLRGAKGDFLGRVEGLDIQNL